MEFHYDDAFGPTAVPDAYERLLLDVIKGDASLFTRGDSIELAWELIDPILTSGISGNSSPLTFYESGSWGPIEAERLLAEDGGKWVVGCHVEPKRSVNRSIQENENQSERFVVSDPGRTRTFNQLIKSQLLCQLSYRARKVKRELYHPCPRFHNNENPAGRQTGLRCHQPLA